MLLAILIVSVLTLAALVAFALVIPARVSDLHASVTACFETIEAHIDSARVEDPRVKTFQILLSELSALNRQANDRIMALTHPAYLREFRRDQVAASQGKVRETPAFPQYGEFGEELMPPPTNYAAFKDALKAKREAPSVAPPEAQERPAPAGNN